LIAALQPSCVVCTHAFPCGIMSHYKRRIDPSLPVVGIVTDYVVHPFWIYHNVDAYAVATEEMHASLLSRGVDAERIHVTGIPVDPRFALIAPKARARRELGIDPGARRVVLIMAGGLGIGPLEMMLRALRDVRRPLMALVLVGKNDRRRLRLRHWCRSWPYPVEVRGFEENVYDYMHAADLLLTKPGGLSVSEALVARLPMVLVKPLGGQEQRNTRYLLSHGAAEYASTEEEIAAASQRLLDSAAERRCLLERAESLRRPEAAADVAAIVRQMVAREPARLSARGSR
jgi:processive 1,2-diacylglycerol beta-glucosyltransferase